MWIFLSWVGTSNLAGIVKLALRLRKQQARGDTDSMANGEGQILGFSQRQTRFLSTIVVSYLGGASPPMYLSRTPQNLLRKTSEGNERI
jgi:hypothetical protein